MKQKLQSVLIFRRFITLFSAVLRMRYVASLNQVWFSLLLVVLLNACTLSQQMSDKATGPFWSDATLEQGGDGRAPAPRPSFVSLKPGTRLAELAQQLDEIALDRSAAVQQRRAAEAVLRATKFERYPQLSPTGSAPLTGDGEPSLGLSLKQVIWDGGRIRAELAKEELNVADAGLRAWLERNEMVQDGLEAYVDMSRFRARIDTYQTLQDDLETLDERLKTRVAGGIADRGERLRMRVALQEEQRAMIRNESDLRQARADLARGLARGTVPTPLASLEAASQSCRREWPAMEAPDDAIAGVNLRLAKEDEELVRAKRFPRVVLSVGVSTLLAPAVGVQLDPADMLGLGRQNTIAAAVASTEAAKVAYEQQKRDTQTDLARLEESYKGHQADIEKLTGLIRTNEETLQLFHEQIEAGSIPLTEGITIYQENAEARVSLIDARARVLANCLRSSALRGVLVPFGQRNG